MCAMPFLIVLDANIATLALPAIRNSLGFSASQLQWVIISFGLSFGGLLLLAGRLADVCDRRLMLCGGLVTFSVASLAVGVAPSTHVLIAARILQGASAAAAFPAALASLTELHANGQRRRALGLYAIASSAGFFSANLVGGGLADLAGWRAMFMVAAPIGTAAAAVLWFMPGPYTERLSVGRLDKAVVAEVPALVVAATAVVFGLMTVAQPGGTFIGLAALIGGAVVAGAFGVLLRRGRTVLLPLSVIRSRPVWKAAGAAALLIAGGVATMVLLSFYLQDERGLSTTEAGLVLTLLGLAGLTGGTLLGAIGAKHSLTAALRVAISLQAVSAIAMALAARTGAMGLLLAGVAIFGLAHFAATGALAGLITDSLARQDHGVAVGLLQTAQQLGAAMGLALISIYIASSTRLWPGFLCAAVFSGIAVIVAATTTASSPMDHRQDDSGDSQFLRVSAPSDE